MCQAKVAHSRWTGRWQPDGRGRGRECLKHTAVRGGGRGGDRSDGRGDNGGHKGVASSHVYLHAKEIWTCADMQKQYKWTDWGNCVLDAWLAVDWRRQMLREDALVAICFWPGLVLYWLNIFWVNVREIFHVWLKSNRPLLGHGCCSNRASRQQSTSPTLKELHRWRTDSHTLGDAPLRSLTAEICHHATL